MNARDRYQYWLDKMDKNDPLYKQLLDIKDDEPEMASPRDKVPNMGALQERLDKLLKISLLE